MRQIEDSWKIKLKNPPNPFEVYENIQSNNFLNSDYNQELNNYRKKNLKQIINKKCSSICLNSIEINFKLCFDNCEEKLQKSDYLFFLTKKFYLDFKATQTILGKENL